MVVDWSKGIKIISSKRRPRWYRCDYCEKVFPKQKMNIIKLKPMTYGWGFLYKYFICFDCEYEKKLLTVPSERED